MAIMYSCMGDDWVPSNKPSKITPSFRLAVIEENIFGYLNKFIASHR